MPFFIDTACIACLSIKGPDLSYELTALSEFMLPSDLPTLYIKGHSIVMLSCNLLG